MGKVDMLSKELMIDEGILIVTPEGPLEEADFTSLAADVDSYIEKRGQLQGLMIYVKSFPGWDSFAGMLSHLKFVMDHHQQIQKIAVVTDGGVLKILPQIAGHFVAAQIKHFPYQEKESAIDWLKSVFT
jgi:hypothetical protein